GPIFVFGLVPIFDLIGGKDPANPPEDAAQALEADPYYRLALVLYIPLQYAALIWACGMWASGRLTALESLGLALTVGVVAGAAINIAHELGHKHAPLERRLAKLALVQSVYGHFTIEHNGGHHVQV